MEGGEVKAILINRGTSSLHGSANLSPTVANKNNVPCLPPFSPKNR
jgi:hypothetical protein